MLHVVGFCDRCKCNVYASESGETFCSCNKPKQKEIKQIESIIRCVRCQKEVFFIGEKKINRNRKYCLVCKVEILKENTKRYHKKIN